jgi:basic membrane protein A
VKRLLLFILLIALLLPACGPRPQDCARESVFCAGLVTPAGGIDQGLGRQAWLGILDAQAAGILDRADFIETVDPRDRAKNISTLAEAGYDVIVTVGFAMGDETAAAAERFPQLLFIGIDQPLEVPSPNHAALLFREDLGGFLAGALAAGMTQTGRIGALCEEEFIDSMRRYCEGFRAGALYVEPATRVEVVYRDGPSESLFGDRGWGHETALRLVRGGTDVLFAAGGGTADAAMEAGASQGIYVIGADYDLYSVGTDLAPRLLTSAIKAVRPALEGLLRQAASGSLSGGEVFGRMELAPFHEAESQVPADLAERLSVVQQGLENGSIHTQVPFYLP